MKSMQIGDDGKMKMHNPWTWCIEDKLMVYRCLQKRRETHMSLRCVVPRMLQWSTKVCKGERQSRPQSNVELVENLCGEHIIVWNYA